MLQSESYGEVFYLTPAASSNCRSWKLIKNGRDRWSCISIPRDVNEFRGGLAYSIYKTTDEVVAWIMSISFPFTEGNTEDRLKSRGKYIYKVSPPIIEGSDLHRAFERYYRDTNYRYRSRVNSIESHFLLPFLDYCSIRVDGVNRPVGKEEKSDLTFGLVCLDFPVFISHLMDNEVVAVLKRPTLTFNDIMSTVMHTISLEMDLKGRRKKLWMENYCESEFDTITQGKLIPALGNIVKDYVGRLYPLTLGEFKYGLNCLYSKPLPRSWGSVVTRRGIVSLTGGNVCLADTIELVSIESVEILGNCLILKRY